MITSSAESPAPRPSRRIFLRYAGATTAGAALLLAGCDTSSDPQPTSTTDDPTLPTVGVGSGEIALLNLMQAGKQVAAELYGRLTTAPTSAVMSADDLSLLTPMLEHTKLHRDALKVIVNTFRPKSNNTELGLPALTVDFSAFDLTTRDSALRAALALANLNASLTVGIARYYSRGPLLTLNGKILGVDSRHAAALADLLLVDEVFDPAPSATSPAISYLRTPSVFIKALNLYLANGFKLIAGSLP